MYAILTSKPGQFRSDGGDGLMELEAYDYLSGGRLLARFAIAQAQENARVRIIDEADPHAVNSVPAKFLPSFRTIDEARAELRHLTRFGNLDARLVRHVLAPEPAPVPAADTVHITFVTNNERRVTAPANSNLLRVSLREQGGIPFKCGGGVCGTCKCRIEAGLEHTDAVKPKERRHLSDAQLAQGWRMACQTFVNGDIRVAW